MMHKLWCEARCEGIYDDDFGKLGAECLETSNGAFGYQNAVKSARAQGWKCNKAGWLCPACQKRRKAKDARTK